MLHAKLMIIDEKFAEVDPANYDMRSVRLKYEVCEVLYSADVFLFKMDTYYKKGDIITELKLF